MNATSLQRHALTVIVFAQLCGTSLWFSVNGVGLSLSRDLGFSEVDLGRLTLAVQAGFICGTLFIAITGLADRFRASRIFAASCLAGALVNGAFVSGQVLARDEAFLVLQTGATALVEAARRLRGS